MKTIAIIPARSGSKRIPHKNIRKLGGRPLIQWSIELALRSKLFDRIVVSSDDSEALQIAGSSKEVIALERPHELALDQSPAIDYVRHCLTYLKSTDYSPNAFLILQPTSPFTEVSDLKAAFDLMEKTNAESVVSLMEVPHHFHPLKAKKLKGTKIHSYGEDEAGRMAAHELDKAYVRNCAIYLSRVSVLERGQVIGDPCHGFVMPTHRSIDINEEIDWEWAEFLMTKENRR